MVGATAKHSLYRLVYDFIILISGFFVLQKIALKGFVLDEVLLLSVLWLVILILFPISSNIRSKYF